MTNPTITVYILLITFLLYLIQDGRALMLCVFAPFCSKMHRVTIFNDILPSWDANQTWLVFTIAGLYGAFPTFFGQVLSQSYVFFLIFLWLLILRGASIEFYIKSTRFKSYWLFLLAIASFSIVICQIYLCQLLLSPYHFSSVSCIMTAAFILWFNFTQAYCFLFRLTHFTGLMVVLGLFCTSTTLLQVFEVYLWKDAIITSVFLVRIALLSGFLTLSIFVYPPKWFGKTLLYYLFLTNAFFVIQTLIPNLTVLAHDKEAVEVAYSAYFVINVFSIGFLPVIAYSLSRMKDVFATNYDEISY